VLEGEIHQINLVERLIELWREKFTGAIRFENDGVIKIIYFKEGDILSASTNDRADSVDEILMRAGKVSREHVKQALAKRKENETLGDALLNLGFITRKELAWGRRVQVVNVIRSISEWSAGSFTIVADYLPKREEGTIFPLPQIIVELIVTDSDRQKFEKLLGSGSAVFEKGTDFDQFKHLGLNEDAEKIVAQIDGQRTASEIADASKQESFNAFKLLHALGLLGILRRKEAPAPAASDSFESAGVADAADAWSVPMPKFDLDDAPPVELTPPAPSIPAGTPEPEPPAMPSWDMAAETAGGSAVSAAEAEAKGAPAGEGWGFDEAQVEAAKNIYVPPPPVAPPSPVPTPPPRKTFDGTTTLSGTQTRLRRAGIAPPPKKKSRFGLILALMIVFIAAGAGYGGYVWWKGREVPQPVAPVARPAEPPPTITAPTTTAAVTTAASTPGGETPVTATVGETTTAAVAPPVVPPPTPVERKAPAPRASSVAERYAAMAREFAANATGNFTIQFAIVCEPSNVTKALDTGGTNVWFVPITIKERSCFRLFWNRYATREEAERGLQNLPAGLRESRPAVVSIPR
jgi:hypothetical protein